jgi:phosphate starvation-inducible PhoH-like protein
MLSKTKATKVKKVSRDREQLPREGKYSLKEKAMMALEPIQMNIKFNHAQKKLCNVITQNEITICTGPAGVGKSATSLCRALEYLKKSDNSYEQIIIVTPAVEADENLGFLPGSADEKMLPYLFSSFYLIEKLIGEEAANYLKSQKVITNMPLAYMRGINIDNAIVVFEEAQNCTKKQMKTFLTRIGMEAKFIISGDLEQSDKFKNVKECGLYHAMKLLEGVEGVGIFEFTKDDPNMRNVLVGRILEKYNEELA